MRILFRSLWLAALLAGSAQAANFTVSVEIPELNVAAYHRPYVAIWLERPDRSVAADLAVWYDTEEGEGTKWLKDLRQWWRRSGRDHSYPIDGVSGATKPVGTHTLTFDGKTAPLAGLAPGEYGLVVEAARELGGREQLRLPFSWPPAQAEQKSAQGKHELGRVDLDLEP